MGRVTVTLAALGAALNRARTRVVSSFSSFAWADRTEEGMDEDAVASLQQLVEDQILATGVAGYIRLVYSGLPQADLAPESWPPQESNDLAATTAAQPDPDAPAWPTPFSDLPADDEDTDDPAEDVVELTCSAWHSSGELTQAWMAIPELPEDDNNDLGLELLGAFRVELLDRDGNVIQRRAVSTRVSELMLGRPALLAVAMELSTFDRRNQLEAAYSASSANSAGTASERAPAPEEGESFPDDAEFPKPAWDADTRAQAIARRS